MPQEPADTHLVTDAWQMLGITRSLPGQLRLTGGVLSFVHDSGEVLFRTPLRHVSRVTFPWYYFGGGCKLSVDGVRHRLSFVRPNDADDAMDRLSARAGDAGAVYSQVAGKVVDIGTGRDAGRAWREVLTQRP